MKDIIAYILILLIASSWFWFFVIRTSPVDTQTVPAVEKTEAQIWCEKNPGKCKG